MQLVHSLTEKKRGLEKQTHNHGRLHTRDWSFRPRCASCAFQLFYPCVVSILLFSLFFRVVSIVLTTVISSQFQKLTFTVLHGLIIWSSASFIFTRLSNRLEYLSFLPSLLTKLIYMKTSVPWVDSHSFYLQFTMATTISAVSRTIFFAAFI